MMKIDVRACDQYEAVGWELVAAVVGASSGCGVRGDRAHPDAAGRLRAGVLTRR